MREGTTKAAGRQAVTWEGLEGCGREQVQQLIQEVLEAEVTERWGWSKSQRRAAVDARPLATATVTAKPAS